MILPRSLPEAAILPKPSLEQELRIRDEPADANGHANTPSAPDECAAGKIDQQRQRPEPVTQQERHPALWRTADQMGNAVFRRQNGKCRDHPLGTEQPYLAEARCQPAFGNQPPDSVAGRQSEDGPA